MRTGRTRYVVSYDISDPRRLRRVHKTVKDFGWALQYSVFICDLDAIELMILKQELATELHHGEDAVAFINLGPPSSRGRDCFEFMGLRPDLPTSGPTII